MKPFFILDDKKEPFAKGYVLEDERCTLSFLRADYNFVYENLAQVILMHGNEGKNEIQFLDHKDKKEKKNKDSKKKKSKSKQKEK